MNMHHIRYFLAVCETMNFTRAAELCNVTQPALSRAIQQLEGEVGGVLFRRERNLTHLTDLGALLRPRLEQISGNLAGVARDAKRFVTLDKASVTIGVMRTIGPRRFAGFLANFGRSHPAISLNLVEDVPPNLRKRLHDCEIDAAIMADPLPFADDAEATVLYRERFLIAFSPEHRFSRMETVPIAALDGEIYLRRLNCEFRDSLAQLLKDKGAAITVAYESEREDWILTLVASGFGVCFVPEFSAFYPGLSTRPVVEPEVWREVCLVLQPGRRQSPSVQVFSEAACNYVWPPGRYSSAAEEV